MSHLRSEPLVATLMARAFFDILDYEVDGLDWRVAKRRNGVLVRRWLHGDKLRIVAELDGTGAMLTLQTEIATQLREWISEVDSVLRACDLMARYFGGAEVATQLSSSMRLPLVWLDALREATTGRLDLHLARKRARMDRQVFGCDRELARILTPLLVFIVEPVPRFLAGIRQQAEASQLDEDVVRAYGILIGSLAASVCYPMWESFPDLKPAHPNDEPTTTSD